MVNEALTAGIDEARLWARHQALAEHGATAAGGVNRQALSDEEIAARRVLVEWGRAIGLAPFSDAIGNLFLRYEGTDAQAPPVLTGSHIDSQPTGGKFDGTFGVLAGLEAVEAMRAAGFRPRRSIEVVAWTNEEGSRFAPGMMGSTLFRGSRELADMLAVRDGAGSSVAECVRAVRAAEPDVPERALGFPVAAYVEAHIEQGPLLELERKTIGVVSGIQGKRVFRVTVTGEENHAGTSPRRVRKDALVAAVAMLGRLHAEMHDDEDVVKFTVGLLEVSPNAPSVVPARVHFSIDLRHPDPDVLARLGDRIAPICEAVRGPCAVEVRELSHDPPLEFPIAMRDLVRDAAAGLGLAHMDLPSAAGHDARHLHYLCPTGMIFVPCAGGISHNEAESCTPADLAAGARVLVEVLGRLAA
ncbi:MAG: M20 family metallo-hydrolase [Ectothiorhodospiraceae bacterium]|nr:M20 family metallo-hydrolase [Ectothiorhodospiraceae bacterium]